MYVERLDSSWLKHPFLFSKLKEIKSENQVKKLKTAGVKSVYINTELGLDVFDPPHAMNSAQQAVQSPVSDPAQETDSSDGEAINPPEETEPVPLFQEIETARSLYSSATQFVRNFFQDARAGKIVDYKEAVPLVEGIIESVFRNPYALSILANLRLHEEYTYTHSVNVAAMAVVFGKSLALPRKELIDLGVGGLYHDVGKFRISDEILKKPGELSRQEYEVIKKHPAIGYKLIQNHTELGEKPLRIILEHHERFDGMGYPRGLRGSSVCKAANMVSVVDTYDALTADRAYRKAADPHFALRTMYLERKERYYYNLLEQFIKCLGIYPVGSFVKLTTGHYAIVIEANPFYPLSPTVKIMLDKNMKRRSPEVIKLSEFLNGQRDRISIVEGLDPEKLTFKRRLLEQAVFA